MRCRRRSYLAVWRRAARYDPARGSVQSWLLTIVRHCAIDAHRRRYADRWVNDAALAETSDGSDTHALAYQQAAVPHSRALALSSKFQKTLRGG